MLVWRAAHGEGAAPEIQVAVFPGSGIMIQSHLLARGTPAQLLLLPPPLLLPVMQALLSPSTPVPASETAMNANLLNSIMCKRGRKSDKGNSY